MLSRAVHGQRLTASGEMGALIASRQQPAAIMRVTAKAVYRYPFTVYRLLHRMTNEVLTHGSRLTVDGHRRDGRFNSQQPEARS
jgi:hypothetical protein